MLMRGERALITGGCGAIGLAITRELLDRGKSVILCDLNGSGARELGAPPDRLTVVECDLARPDELERKLRPVIESGVAPDILVNAVGRAPKTDAEGRPLTLETTSMDLWNDLFATNLGAYFYCSKLIVPGMKAKGYGRIIHIGSYVARTGGLARNSIVYVASKAAVLGLTKAMARELAPYGITVNVINPGRIQTPMNTDVSGEETQEFLKRVPLNRLGRPMDVAGAVLYFASDLADYVTGAALEVNGGLYMSP